MQTEGSTHYTGRRSTTGPAMAHVLVLATPSPPPPLRSLPPQGVDEYQLQLLLILMGHGLDKAELARLAKDATAEGVRHRPTHPSVGHSKHVAHKTSHTYGVCGVASGPRDQ